MTFETGAIRLVSASTLLMVKGADESGRRILRGIASTINPDLQGDVMLPRGAVYSLPQPLLIQHEHGSPVGKVLEVVTSDRDIRITAEVARGVGRSDEAWALVLSGLMGGLSIGFIGLEHEANGRKGLKWKSWNWIETSIVTIAANSEARIIGATGKASSSIQLTAARPRDAIQLVRQR